jgi:type IV secretion system protein TrbL
MTEPLFGLGDLNPLDWLGNAAGEAIGQGWTAAMVASWSAAMWILQTTFGIADKFTSPDLTAGGPMRSAYGYTFGLGATVAAIMAFTQVGLAALRRDGASLARVLVGVIQFGAVWMGYVGVAAALTTAASGLTHGLLHGLLGIDNFSGYRPGSDWPRDVNDTVTATVLGISAWLLIWPASLMWLFIMLVRESALLLLVATSPIAASGLLSDAGRTWFWKSLRWFLTALLVAPLSALVLGVGTQITDRVVQGAGHDTPAAVGTAVVGSAIILVGALCPLVLFRLLAFVDPGTSSGIAMRGAVASNGGIRGFLTRDAGSSAASHQEASGRSGGEATADAATAARFSGSLSSTAGNGAAGAAAGKGAGAAGAAAGAMGVVVAGVAAVGRTAQTAVAVSSDVLSSSGVGHTQPYYPPYDPAPRRRTPPPRQVAVRHPNPDSSGGSDGAPEDAHAGGDDAA